MPIHLNLVVAQIPLVGQLTGAEMAAPQAQAQVAREAAFEKLVEDRQKIPKTEHGAGLAGVDKDTPQRDNHSRPRRRHRRHEPLPPEPAVLHAHSEGPFEGRIINVNI